MKYLFLRGNNGQEFSKISQRFQSTDPRSSENIKQDKNKHTKYPNINIYSNYWKPWTMRKSCSQPEKQKTNYL